MKFYLNGLRLTALATVLAAQTAFAAGTAADQPSVILYGGGATLPANAYVGDTWLDAVPARRLSNTLPPAVGAPSNANAASKTSLFGEYSLLSAVGAQKSGVYGVSYCQTGSGTGRGVIKNTVIGNGICGDYASTPTGFSADSRKADFGASDAPLSQGDINSFNASSASTSNPAVLQTYNTLYTQPVQMPGVAGSIAVVYNNPDLGKVQINLTRSDVCGIFSGQITNWSALSSHTPKLKTVLPSKTIKVVYRSDGSGTTFSFTNFLSKVCGSLNLPGDTAVPGFRTTDTFGGANGNTSGSQPAFGTSPAGATAVVPAGAIGASGNGNVVGTVSSTDGAIGYAEVSDAVTRAKRSGGSNLKFSTVSRAADVAKSSTTVAIGSSFTCPAGTVAPNVFDNTTGTKALKASCKAVVYNKLDPAKNFLVKGDTAVAVTTTPDMVLSGIDANGRPNVVAPTAGTLNDTGSDVAGCVQLVAPDAYAEPSTSATKASTADYTRFPITAVSYLLAYGTGYNPTAVAAPNKTTGVKGLLKSTNDATILAKVKTIGKTTGFAPLTITFGAGSAGTGTVASFVDACVRD